MPGPWEKYAAAIGPWTKYAKDNSQPTQFERDRLSDVGLVPVQRAVAKAAGKPAPDLRNLEPTAEGNLVPRGTTAAAMPVAAANNMLYPGTGTAASGVANIAQGNVARGAHQVISGGFDALSTATPMALTAAPAMLGRAMVGGVVGSKVGSTAADLLGASPDVQDLSGDVGGAVGGGLAAGAPSMFNKAKAQTADLSPLAKAAVKQSAIRMIPGAKTASNVYNIYKSLGDIAEALRQGKATPEAPTVSAEAPVAAPVPVNAPVPKVAAAPQPAPTVDAAAYPKISDPAVIGAKPKIRASADAARSWKTPADIMDDNAFLDYARNDLERHGQNAALEASREFAARNSMDVPKWQRVAESKAADVLEQAQKQVEQILQEAQKAKETPIFTKTPGYKPLTPATPEDLTALLEKSIAAAKAKKRTK